MNLKRLTFEYIHFFSIANKHSATTLDNIQYGYVQEPSLLELQFENMKEHYYSILSAMPRDVNVASI